MALTDSQRKMYVDKIAQAKKRIIDIQARAQREIATEEKKIIDTMKILDRG